MKLFAGYGRCDSFMVVKANDIEHAREIMKEDTIIYSEDIYIEELIVPEGAGIITSSLGDI